MEKFTPSICMFKTSSLLAVKGGAVASVLSISVVVVSFAAVVPPSNVVCDFTSLMVVAAVVVIFVLSRGEGARVDIVANVAVEELATVFVLVVPTNLPELVWGVVVAA